MIYTAEREDLPQIVEMSLKIPEELGFDNFPVEDVGITAKFIYNKWLEYPIFVYRVDDKIVGFIGVSIETMWWSDQEIVHDYVMYIDPDHRNLKVINSLIGAVRDFAKLNGLPVISHFISNDRTEAKAKLFERQGFKISGFIATYGV